jgi:hypothetical protein
MSHNPYAAPRARSLDETARLYSPTQVALGTFLGGIGGLVYFLRANFLALDQPVAARNTVLGGAAALLAIVLISMHLPGGGGIGFSIAAVLLARWIAERHQMSKEAIEASSDHDFHSSWRVFLIALACFVVTLVLVLALFMALAPLLG